MTIKIWIFVVIVIAALVAGYLLGNKVDISFKHKDINPNLPPVESDQVLQKRAAEKSATPGFSATAP